ncbi:hypothetical protein H8N03_11675 [Ramlibacter sp. USB13]|uniref:DUF4034 domain-containing protein n=1 Tax=Ramlibacter cellulosilyticus TaxID=2764187 RepID=A0A923MRG2_9BURK|nr:hypothetical protein [Ramlibacter cellulosilyticus]MBC5783606.1 hypothetical protein [Ramlibacter cellulosilyticus]
MIRAAALAVALLSAGAFPSVHAEISDVKDVHAAFAAQRYDEIEALYDKVLRERRRAADGRFQSEVFLGNLPWYSDDDPASESYWPKVDAATAAWLAHSPGSPLAAMVRAHVLARRGNRLSAIGRWKEVDALVAEARRLLAGAREQGKRDANWHAVRLRVLGVEGVPREDVLDAIHAAAAVDPYPLRPWQFAALALSPDGRSTGDLPWLMRLAVERTRTTEGTTMYARVLASAYWHFPHLAAHPFGHDALDWNVAHRSFTELKQRYPEGYEPNLHGALACLAGDRAVTAAALAQAGAYAREDVWKIWGGDKHLARCRAWSTGEAQGPRA